MRIMSLVYDFYLLYVLRKKCFIVNYLYGTTGLVFTKIELVNKN